MNFLTYCALVLLVGLSLGMFVRLFRRVYAGGGDTVQVAFFSWVDLVLASLVVILIVSQILAATGAGAQTVPANIDTGAMVLVQLSWWGLVLGPILISLRFRGFKLGSVFGFDRMPVGRSVLLGVALLISALPMIYLVDYVASALLRVNPTTDSQEVIQIFETASTAAQRIPIILLAVVIAPVAEELAFRGFLYGVIKRYFAPTGSPFIRYFVCLNPSESAEFFPSFGVGFRVRSSVRAERKFAGANDHACDLQCA